MRMASVKGDSRYLRSLWIFCVFCGCMFLAAGAWAGELEDLKKRIDELEKAQKDTQVKEENSTKWAEKIEMGYDNRLYIKTRDEKYSLNLRFLIQLRYRYIFVDAGRNTSTFLIPHGQTRIFGNVFSPKLKYRVMFELPGTAGGSTANLRDMWTDWQLRDSFSIRVGQFLVPYDNENLEPTWALQFVDRSIINANLGFERDLGVDIHGVLFSKHVEYDLFIMNGDGRNRISLNNRPMIGGRIMMYILHPPHLTDDVPHYFIPDLKRCPFPYAALGLAAIYDAGNANINNNKVVRATGDFAFRYMGFSALGLANMARNIDSTNTDYGFLGQLGYFIVPERFEIAARWAKIHKNGALSVDATDPQEAGATLNGYIVGHNLKIQADYSHLWNDMATQGQDDDRIRVQVQMFF